ncbi:MAG: RICIN domain-containing protein [Actinomycetota bacterium]|nr:RICIN domain-containing protein [Actinomycetota bacterium]
MAVRGVLIAAVLTMGSLVGFVPAANAAPEPVLVIESANGSEDVWTQSSFDTNPVTGAEFRETNRQYWIFDDDERTIRNIGTGLCATAVDRDRIKGRGCDDDDPGQKWSRGASGNSRLLVNEEFDTCAEYRGLDNPLGLQDCDADNRKQRWYLNEQ